MKMAKIFDGKAVREYNLDKIAQQVEALKEKGVLPTLAVIIVGSDPASRLKVEFEIKLVYIICRKQVLFISYDINKFEK